MYPERRQDAINLFEELLSCANHVGLLSEDIDTRTKELWGNFPQSFCTTGIIRCARRLSKAWP
jgi:GH15 family glucan-1,4-alpha-glucosidase